MVGLLAKSAKESLDKIDMLKLKAAKGIRSALEQDSGLNLRKVLRKKR